MFEQQIFQIEVQDQLLKLPIAIIKFSDYLKQLKTLCEPNQILKLPQNFKIKQFNLFLKFLQTNKYQDPTILIPIQTNQISKVMDSHNIEFINEVQKTKQFQSLYQFATQIRSKQLRNVLACKYACDLYFKNDVQYYQIKQKLNAKKNKRR